MAELFRFDDVKLRVGDAVVLGGVDVTIDDGGITAVVGPSGSGKSTLLRCCNLLEVPTSGTVTFRGAPLGALDPLRHRRRVAMVFQRPTAFPGTVADNLRVADPTLTDAESAELLGRVGLSATVAGQLADSLSGGEAQRMTLARALATTPEVLLADESTSGLDDDAKATLERLVRGLADAGMPVVWVTHDREQVRRLADRTVTIDQGRVTDR